jgi:pyridoxine 5-phosphate synthase
MPRRLGVNIDHVATMRQAREASYPDPAAAAALAELAGADQITCHIRMDRRHIQDHDLPRLRDIVQTQLNVELATTEEMLSIAIALLGRASAGGRQHRITLVPERQGEVTTEGGLDVLSQGGVIAAATRRLTDEGIAVSLFIDPDPAQVAASAIPGVDMIELNTARYAEEGPEELGRLRAATLQAMALGLEVAAGHGLTHHNLPALVEYVPEIVEYNIGHSLIGRSIFVGLDTAVRDLVQIIQS